MHNTLKWILWALLPSLSTWAAPLQTTYHIKVDQFGYFTNATKYAVIADPQAGFNAGEAFSPGTGTDQYQVRRWSDDVIIYSGTLQVWNSGTTHTQSGDRGWWFNFSAVTTPGSYYIYDVANNVGSFRFEIGDNVYADVLKQAVRTFYYQRINFAKQAPYTDSRWADAACFEGPYQDHQATSRYDKGNLSTAKDVSGGWMDAGDKNKYTTFAHNAVIQLLESYRINPTVFTDDYNLPESGNGIPDLLDEIKWELDFLKKMQDATGTQGFLLKVGTDNYNEVTPPSSDTRPRYYVPECTSATIAGCSMLAAAAVILQPISAWALYNQDLLVRAEAAWSRAKSTTVNFTTYQINCDDGDIKSGDADHDAQTQLDNAFVAAAYLYEATGKTEYKTFLESNYSRINPYVINWWGPYWIPQQLALLRLLSLPNLSSTVTNNIRNQKAGMNYLYSYPTYEAGTDLYRSHMETDAYHWGHNQARSGAGLLNLDFITFNINSTSHPKYRIVAEQYLHWLHGVNPLGMVMLSNMYSSGAEKCANEIYHTWFANGSAWDNALTSSKGPAPGYMPGGPNKNYTGTLTYLTTEPPQKAYKDWNNDWPENSWEITEPSIYCQASYIMLLSRLMSPGTNSGDVEVPTAPANLWSTGSTTSSISLQWNKAKDNIGVTAYELYSGANLVSSAINDTFYTVNALTCNTSYSFTVKARDAAGNRSASSNMLAVSTQACPVSGSEIIYADALHSAWNSSTYQCSADLTSTTVRKSGTYSFKAIFNAHGQATLIRTAGVNTASTTQLRFWVYNTSKNGLKISVYNSQGIKSSTDFFYKPGTNKWVEVIIGLSQFGNPSTIKQITLENNSKTGGTFYFDDIRLDQISSSAAANTATHKPVEESFSNYLKIYPNPARNHVTVQYLPNKSGELHYELLDHSGRTLVRQVRQLAGGMNQWEFRFPELPAGLYYLRLIEGTEIRVKPLQIR